MSSKRKVLVKYNKRFFHIWRVLNKMYAIAFATADLTIVLNCAHFSKIKLKSENVQKKFKIKIRRRNIYIINNNRNVVLLFNKRACSKKNCSIY